MHDRDGRPEGRPSRFPAAEGNADQPAAWLRCTVSWAIPRRLRAIRARVQAAVGGLSPVFWVIWWGTLINRMASFVGVLLALYLRQEHGFTTGEAGWVVGLWGIGGTVAAPFGGVLTDRVGRRNTMLLGLVLGGLSVLAMALVANPILLVVLAFVCGATGQCFFPASNAAIADVVPPPDRPRAYGHVYWAVNLGFAFGFFVAGLVPSRFMFWLFLADAGTTFLCAGLIAWKVPETRPAVVEHEPVLQGLGRVVGDRVFLRLMVLHTVALMVFTQFQLALPLDMADHGVGSQGFSWLMAANCVGVVLLQPWLTPLLKRVDPSRLLAVSALLFGMGYAVNAFVSTLPLYLLGAAFWTVGEVVGLPCRLGARLRSRPRRAARPLSRGVLDGLGPGHGAVADRGWPRHGIPGRARPLVVVPGGRRGGRGRAPPRGARQTAAPAGARRAGAAGELGSRARGMNGPSARASL